MIKNWPEKEASLGPAENGKACHLGMSSLAMNFVQARLLLALPANREALLVLGYVVLVLVGARLVEVVARMHFSRARRLMEQGFEYDAEDDHYRCPEGERLQRHAHDPVRRLAVYRAPAASCNACPLKASCTPHDGGRHIYRSLAAWAETDLGRFHQRMSLLMYVVCALLSSVATWRWAAQPGAGWLAAAAVGSCASLAADVRRCQATARAAAGKDS